MKIIVNPDLMLRLMAYAAAAGSKEFSGFGFCTREGENLRVYDFVVLDVGSEVFTQIPAPELAKLLSRPDARNLRVWLH